MEGVREREGEKERNNRKIEKDLDRGRERKTERERVRVRERQRESAREGDYGGLKYNSLHSGLRWFTVQLLTDWTKVVYSTTTDRLD